MKHPLINPNANYYDGEGKKTPAILDFERENSLTDLRTWARITRDKYRHPNRQGKGEVEKDIAKEKTYSDYYDFLNEIIVKYPPLADITAVNAYDALGYTLEYSNEG